MKVLRQAGRDPGEFPSYVELDAALAKLHGHWLIQTSTDEMSPLTRARLAQHLINLEGFQLRPVDDARFVLSKLGALPLPLLIRCCHAQETYLRNHCLEILRDIGPTAKETASAILLLLDEPISRVLAAETLGYIGNPMAGDALLVLLTDKDPEMRATAADALGPIGHLPAIPALAQMLQHADSSMDEKVQAAFSLSILVPSGPGHEFLQERLQESDYHADLIHDLIQRRELCLMRD